MRTPSIRQKLISYLAGADDSKVKAIYTLLERGQTKSYTRPEPGKIIKE